MAGFYHVRVTLRPDIATNRNLRDLFDVVRRLADRGPGASFRSKGGETDARVWSRNPPALFLGGFSRHKAHLLCERINALGHDELKAEVRLGLLSWKGKGR